MNQKLILAEKERCQQLMMAEIDGETTGKEKAELSELLQKYPELSLEQSTFRQLKEVTQNMKLKQPDAEIWQTYWYNVYNRIERGFAWFIFTLGIGILIVYGLLQAVLDLWNEPNLPMIVKLGIFGILLGLVLLLISTLREKLFLRRHERYKEVKK